VSQFDRQAQRTERNLAKWAKEKYQILLEAKDRISPALSKLGGSLLKFARKTYQVWLMAKDRLSPVLSQIKSGLKGFAGKTLKVTLKARDLVTAPVRGILNLLRNPLLQAGAVLGISIGAADTINTFKDFEAAMSQVAAVSGASGEDLEALTAKAKEMGATTKFTAKEAADAFNYMAMAGWKTEDMLGGIGGILNLAAASGADLATTSDIVTDALTAFGMKASDSGHFADVMAAASFNANTNVSLMGETFKYAGAMAGTLKYSIEDVALATGLMANAGIKGTMAGTALNSIFTRLSTNTNGAADALKNLGIAVFRSDGSARDFADIMEELREATAEFTDEQKAVLGNKVAGTYAQKGFLAILNATAEDYAKLSDAVNNADGAAAEMAERMLDNLEGSLTLLQSAVDGVKISAGERMAPYVRNLADWITEQTPAVEDAVSRLMDTADRAASRLSERFRRMQMSADWQNADIFGKIKIAWDEMIADPFLEWWNSTGQARLAGFAQDIGKGIGAGLKAGVMALLGIDLGETFDEGAGIGASFARGFQEGIDGIDYGAISGKLAGGIGMLAAEAGKLLPGGQAAGLSSLASAAALVKIAAPAAGIGKGIFSIGKALFGKDGDGHSLAGTVFGRAVLTEGVDGSITAGGSGLLGLSARAGQMLGSGASSAAGMAAAGGGAIAGGIAAGSTLVRSGMDAYTAYKAYMAGDSDKAAAFGESAAWEAGGVAAGAGIGAGIGALFGGVGAAPGALIGAGIGGIAGWIKGDSTKKDYEEQLAAAQAEAEKAQKVLQATGMAIGSVHFETEALNAAVGDAGVSAGQLALMLQEAAGVKTAERFGDISLSMKEIQEISSQLVFDPAREELDRFTAAASEAQGSAAALHARLSTLDKLNWKRRLWAGVSGTEASEWKEAAAGLSAAAGEYLQDSHYRASAAAELLAGPDSGITWGLDSMYGSLQEELDGISRQLADRMEIAVQDGIITLNEHEEIVNLQKQITEVTDRVAAAQEEAKFASLKIRYGGAGLDAASFASLQEELKADIEELTAGYDEALQVSLTNLQLQLGEGVIDESQYDEMFQKIADGYNARIDSLAERAGSFQLDAIADAFGKELDMVLPGMAGTACQKLQKAVGDALAISPDASLWTKKDMAGWFGLGGLSAETQAAVGGLIKAAAESLPAGAQELLEAYKAAGSGWGSAVNNGIADSIASGSGQYRAAAVDALLEALAEPLPAEAEILAKPRIRWIDMPEGIQAASGSRGGAYSGSTAMGSAGSSCSGSTAMGSTGGSGSAALRSTWEDSGIPGRAAGGYVSGGPQLSWLAEEGYGEFIIPTNPARRAGALELYRQAGDALGIGAYASGGFTGGRIPAMAPAGIHLSMEAGWNAADAWNTAAGQDNGGIPAYSPAPAGQKQGGTAPDIHVSVQAAPVFEIQGTGQGEEEVIQIIRRHMSEMADELGGEIAVKIEQSYKNMPVEGGGHGY